MKEVFKCIPGIEFYQVSNLGNVKRLSRYSHNGRRGFITKERLLSKTDNKGYLSVKIQKNRYSVHSLVAKAFLNHSTSLSMHIDHINNVKHDNRLENLQIITQRENVSKDRVNGYSKYTGVTKKKNSKKWIAAIVINKKRKHLGYYNTEVEASNAYLKKLKEVAI